MHNYIKLVESREIIKIVAKPDRIPYILLQISMRYAQRLNSFNSLKCVGTL